MGTVKEKKLPTPDTNPVDGDKLIEETKPKKVKKTEEKPKKVKEEPPAPDPFALISEDMNFVFREITILTDWVSELETKLNKIARRLGL